MLRFHLRIMSLLLMIDLQILTPFTSANSICECSSQLVPYQFIDSDTSNYLECCIPNHFNATNIKWYFKGKQQQNHGKSEECSNNGHNGDQFLHLDSPTKEHEGNYTCIISSPDGTNLTSVKYLTVHEDPPCLHGPSFVKVEALYHHIQTSSNEFLPLTHTNTDEKETVTLHVRRGENITLKCSGHFCGGEWGDHIYWRKKESDGEKFVTKDNHVHEEEVTDGKGSVYHILHISIEQEEDFGTYTCYVESENGQVSKSIIITFKTHVLEIVLILLICLIIILLILLFLWWYCRIPWLLYYRNISHNVT
ncbi:unnamed protein product, partial [Meganyctiphanes norvegica]